MGAPQGIEKAPANEFHEFRSLNPSAASIFFENLVISKFPVHEPGCLCTYNFLVSQRLTAILAGDLLEARADQTIFKIFRIHHLRSRRFRSKFENPLIVRPPFVESLPLYTILFYGVTILRIMWDEACERRKALKSRQRANFMNLEA